MTAKKVYTINGRNIGAVHSMGDIGALALPEGVYIVSGKAGISVFPPRDVLKAQECRGRAIPPSPSAKKRNSSIVRVLLKLPVSSGFSTSFTNKELKDLGIKIPEILIAPEKVRSIRKKTRLSQTVFARLLNVSPSSVRQWEQGKRRPTGSTKVLLDILDKKPTILNYRISGKRHLNRKVA